MTSRKHDRTGESIGGATVLRVSSQIGKTTRWLVRGDSCGHEWPTTASTICDAEERDTRLRCPTCFHARVLGNRKAREEGTYVPRTPIRRVTPSRTYERPREREVLCNTCFGLPHRRRRPRCQECREPYEEETVTLEYVMSQPVEHRRPV